MQVTHKYVAYNHWVIFIYVQAQNAQNMITTDQKHSEYETMRKQQHTKKYVIKY